MDKPATITIKRLGKENLKERYCLQIGVEKRSTFIARLECSMVLFSPIDSGFWASFETI